VDRLVSGVDGNQAFTMLHVYDDRIVQTVVPTLAASEVTGREASLAPLLEAMDPAELFDLISRKDSELNKKD
jgi:hypothetical protein